MSPGGRRWRLAATTAFVVALLTGTVWGNDHHFPFGPFRMYSTTTRITGKVTYVRFEATTAGGRRLELTARDMGLRPAEVLGQIPRVRENPSLLRHFVTAYERRSEHRVVAMRLYLLAHRLEGGRPVAIEEETVAKWKFS